MTSWAAAVGAAETRVRAWVTERLAGMFGFTLTAGTSAIGDGDQLQTSDQTDSDQAKQRPARRIEPWGYRSRPPDKVRALWLRLGSSNVLFLGVASDKAYGDSDLDAGDAELYSTQGGTRVRVNHDGSVVIDAGNSKDVSVNGGTAKVNRAGDTVNRNGTLTTWQSNVETALSGLGAPITPFAGTAIGATGGGADHFKG
jgi:phage gp45-like